jgi:flavin-dependent dehydrogenase
MVARDSHAVNLLVVGGGPAGSAAAIAARQAGLSVTIIDASRTPRFRPGESLHPGVEPLLRQLGAWPLVSTADYLRHAGTWVQWGDDPTFVPFGSDAHGPWLGLQAPRGDFDRRLLETARGLGVAIRERVSARRILTHGSRVIGVATGDGPLLADQVIDASGSRHWLATQLGIQILRCSPPLKARYGYALGPPVDRLPSIRADAVGWTWMADLGAGRYSWVRVTEVHRSPPRGWIPDELHGCRPTGEGGADVTWRIASTTAGEGWFAAGDAALVLDPSASHGVLRALMSGMAAARGVVELSGGLETLEDVGREYDAWLSAWFRHDARVMARHYESVGLFGHALTRGSAADGVQFVHEREEIDHAVLPGGLAR